MKSLREKLNKKIFFGVCISLLAIVLCVFVNTGRKYGSQAMNAMYLSAEFQGAYKVADGDWQPYIKGKHIPADNPDRIRHYNFLQIWAISEKSIG